MSKKNNAGPYRGYVEEGMLFAGLYQHDGLHAAATRELMMKQQEIAHAERELDALKHYTTGSPAWFELKRLHIGGALKAVAQRLAGGHTNAAIVDGLAAQASDEVAELKKEFEALKARTQEYYAAMAAKLQAQQASIRDNDELDKLQRQMDAVEAELARVKNLRLA